VIGFKSDTISSAIEAISNYNFPGPSIDDTESVDITINNVKYKIKSMQGENLRDRFTVERRGVEIKDEELVSFLKGESIFIAAINPFLTNVEVLKKSVLEMAKIFNSRQGEDSHSVSESLSKSAKLFKIYQSETFDFTTLNSFENEETNRQINTLCAQSISNQVDGYANVLNMVLDKLDNQCILIFTHINILDFMRKHLEKNPSQNLKYLIDDIDKIIDDMFYKCDYVVSANTLQLSINQSDTSVSIYDQKLDSCGIFHKELINLVKDAGLRRRIKELEDKIVLPHHECWCEKFHINKQLMMISVIALVCIFIYKDDLSDLFLKEGATPEGISHEAKKKVTPGDGS